jgi:hypothetical protein
MSAMDADAPFEQRGGLIGLNLFTHLLDLEVDIAGKSVSFYNPDHCEGGGVYWADEAVILEIIQDKSYQSTVGTRIKQAKPPGQVDSVAVPADLQGNKVTV